MLRLLLIATLAGCSSSVAAPTVAPAAKSIPSATPAADAPAAFVPGTLPPGTTPRGWLVTINSTVAQANGTMAVYRNPQSSNAAPYGETSVDTPGGFCGIRCSAAQSQVSFTSGGGAGAVSGIGVGGGGTSFTASGNVMYGGAVIGAFSATVAAVP